MAEVPFPSSSTPGMRPGEGEGRLINAIPIKEGGRSYIRRSLGLFEYITVGGTGLRGMLSTAHGFFIVYSDKVVLITNPGTPVVNTLTGTIPGSDPVTIAVNTRQTAGGPDVVACRRDGGAYVLTTTTCTAYADADLPSDVNSVSYLDGYFLFTRPGGEIWATGLNTLDVDALSFATAESNPDGLLRGIVSNGLFYAIGSATIEPWKDVGASPFPLQRAQTIIQTGGRATMAAAGGVTGWDHPIYFIAADTTVRAMDGYETGVVSTPDVERFIAASQPDDLEMFVYIEQGRPLAVISNTTETWVYDTRAQSWHERMSGATRWRAKYTMFLNGFWIFGDALTGDLVVNGGFAEPGSSLTYTIESGPLFQFPAPVEIPEVFFHFTTEDADISVSWSKDGGQTWSTPIPKPMAGDGQFPMRVNGLGTSTHHGVRFRLSCSDDLDFSFMGASAPTASSRSQAAV